MELTDDLVAVQGILISVIKSTGDFTRINYKGGNEEKILKVIEEIQKHIVSKNYVKDGKISRIADKQVEDLVMFLAINTKYKKTLELEDYDHLIDIMPQLSKCLLANVVYGLDLCKYYSRVIEKLPICYGVELLEEMVQCLKKTLPNIQLKYSIMFLRSASIKLSSDEITEKDGDDIYALSEITNTILQLLTGVCTSHVKNLKAIQIYQHMGYTLLSLFELLLFCDKENLNLKKFIENVLKTCSMLIKNVSITVFCSWAETKVDDEPLQSIIAGKAYEVVEQYQKHREAKELVSMLGQIAKKPKTLSERIQAADTALIIKKVYANDQDQKAWFQALLGTQFLGNTDALRCVGAYAHLCDENDVQRLLNLGHRSKVEEPKRLALKCASVLNLTDLLLVMTRYFYENKFAGLLPDAEGIESRLKSIFNKMSNQTNTDEDFIKDMCLLMLQSPGVVLQGIFGECLRNTSYTGCYKSFFCSVKEILRINDFGIDTLWQNMSLNHPNDNNVDNYVALLSMLLEIDYLSNEQVVNVLLSPLLEQFRYEKSFAQMGYVLQIFLGCSIKIPATSEMTNLRWSILNAMNDCRCTFLELDTTKQQTANYAVNIIRNLCEVCLEYNFEEECTAASSEAAQDLDEFTNYYVKYLSSTADSTLLRTLYSDFNIENYSECVEQVLRFLPRAVTSEWSDIVREVFSLCGSTRAMELLTDTMVLLCSVVQTQDPDTNTGQQVIVALKYCMRQYGIALQNVQSDSTLDMEVDVTRGVCRLLKHLPEMVKEEEGLSIINVLSERSLKSLNEDREFVCWLISINNRLICKTLASRMMD